jgi:hypothetical protein
VNTSALNSKINSNAVNTLVNSPLKIINIEEPDSSASSKYDYNFL